MKRSTLWIAATPIGNTDDLSPRARKVLSRAHTILAEDTRRAGLLFQRAGLDREGVFLSLFEHNEEARVSQVLDLLGQGNEVALMSDAGTPLVSDPGYRLVRAAREAGHLVSPLPGPSAVTAALSACGLPPHPFAFLGFLPRKRGQAERILTPFADLPATLVLFERKDRLDKTLALCREVLGDRECCLARELTKEHEEFLSGTLSEPGCGGGELLGEITLVIGPPGERTASKEEVLEAYRLESRAGGKPREVARRAASRLPGWTAKTVYETMKRFPELHHKPEKMDHDV